MSKSRKRMPSYRPWGSTEDGRIEFESLTNETLEGALNVIRKSFFLYEPISVAVDLKSEPGAPEELEELCLFAAKDGVSVVAVDITTNEVVGVAFNKIQLFNGNSEKNYFEHFSKNCKCKSSKALVDFMINMDARVNLFKHYNVNCILELMFLATLPDHGKRRIGELLTISSLELGKELRRGKNVKTPVTIHDSDEVTNADAVPALLSGIATSNYSYRIMRKLHFDLLLEVSFDEFEINGKKYSEKIDPVHQQCYLVAKRLTI
ncbi:hypothetical protein P5V15_008558 [Pogonomyrmex californicus]